MGGPSSEDGFLPLRLAQAHGTLNGEKPPGNTPAPFQAGGHPGRGGAGTGHHRLGVPAAAARGSHLWKGLASPVTVLPALVSGPQPQPGPGAVLVPVRGIVVLAAVPLGRYGPAVTPGPGSVTRPLCARGQVPEHPFHQKGGDGPCDLARLPQTSSMTVLVEQFKLQSASGPNR